MCCRRESSGMTGASASQALALVLCHLPKLCSGCRYAQLSGVSRLCVSSVYQKLKSVCCVCRSLNFFALMPVPCSVQTQERHKQLCCQAGPLLQNFLWKRKFQAAYVKHQANTAAHILRRQAAQVYFNSSTSVLSVCRLAANPSYHCSKFVAYLF